MPRLLRHFSVPLPPSKASPPPEAASRRPHPGGPQHGPGPPASAPLFQLPPRGVSSGAGCCWWGSAEPRSIPFFGGLRFLAEDGPKCLLGTAWHPPTPQKKVFAPHILISVHGAWAMSTAEQDRGAHPPGPAQHVGGRFPGPPTPPPQCRPCSRWPPVRGGGCAHDWNRALVSPGAPRRRVPCGVQARQQGACFSPTNPPIPPCFPP